MTRIHNTAALLIFLLLTGIGVLAQDKALYEKKWFVHRGDTLPYRILLPKNFDPAKKYPLILVLHGAGERGSNNESQLVHGAKLFLQDSVRERFPAIVVFPQCPARSYWSNAAFIIDSVTKKRSFGFLTGGEPTLAMSLLMRFVDELREMYRLDKDRLYVGGLSMGGMGTFELVRRKPKLFAAAFPICGGANTATARRIRKPSWWIFHGMKDDVVLPKYSMDMAAALKESKADVKLTLYPNANHNSWDPAFAEPGLLPWLFSKHK